MDKRRAGESESKRRARRRWTPGERAQVLSAYRASGKTQEEFAAQTGLSVGTLRGWPYMRPPAGGERGHLAPVRIVEGGRPVTEKHGAVTVRWPQGIEVEIAVDLDGAGALQLVRELLGPCLR